MLTFNKNQETKVRIFHASWQLTGLIVEIVAKSKEVLYLRLNDRHLKAYLQTLSVKNL